jgi:hypothetical protein
VNATVAFVNSKADSSDEGEAATPAAK